MKNINKNISDKFHKIFQALCNVAGLLPVLTLLLIFIFIFFKAINFFLNENISSFFFGFDWEPPKVFGSLSMIFSSVYVSLGALFLAFPVAICCAIFCSEFSSNRTILIKRIIRYLMLVLASIPSVIYGLLGLSLLLPIMGYSMGLAIIVLSVMLLPTLANVSYDSLRAIPQELKDASIALGATKTETIWKIILPSAKSGIALSVFLAFGRAFGEAMAVRMLIGNTQSFPNISIEKFFGLLSPSRTLSSGIMTDIENVNSERHLGALFATALLLLLINIIVNIISRTLISKRSSSKAFSKVIESTN